MANGKMMLWLAKAHFPSKMAELCVGFGTTANSSKVNSLKMHQIRNQSKNTSIQCAFQCNHNQKAWVDHYKRLLQSC